MAQIKKSVAFKNAVIDLHEGTITEFMKDGTKTYNLSDVLKEWDGIQEISFSIQQTNDIPSNEDMADEVEID